MLWLVIHRRAFRNLRAYLYKTNTSQKAFAHRLGVHPSFVSHMLRGRKQPSLPMAAKIAQEANIPIESLLGLEIVRD